MTCRFLNVWGVGPLTPTWFKAQLYRVSPPLNLSLPLARAGRGSEGRPVRGIRCLGVSGPHFWVWRLGCFYQFALRELGRDVCFLAMDLVGFLKKDRVCSWRRESSGRKGGKKTCSECRSNWGTGCAFLLPGARADSGSHTDSHCVVLKPSIHLHAGLQAEEEFPCRGEDRQE